jgi:XTP/dITP diphosphohydrolase
MKTYVATTNSGKLREMRAMLLGSELELTTYPGYAAVVEDAADYAGNALLKARGLAARLREAGIEAAVLADDSGLEVDALDGRPGVLSARYAGKSATWPQRLARLLSELDGVAQARRGARFVSAMAFIWPDGREIAVDGRVEGYIATAERGAGGFGYDPVFFYPPRGCTFAELSEDEKNAISHRRHAADALLAALRQRAGR